MGGGSHPLDLLRWFSGSEVVEAGGYAVRAAFPGMVHGDCQVALFRFEDGAVVKVAALYAPRCEMAPYYNLRLYGTMGTVERDRVALVQDENDVHPEFRPVEADRIRGHPYDAEVEDCLDSIRVDRSPRCGLFDGANSTAAALVAHRSMSLGTPLPLPRHARDP